MKPELRRKSQVGIGFTILVFAIMISYFSVEEIDTKKIMSVERYSKRFLLKKNIDFEELCCVSEQCAD